MTQRNFNNYRDKLTEADTQEIFELLSEGLRQKNLKLLSYRLEHCLERIPHYGILERIHHDEPSGWTYCAGQDYPSEIKDVRKIILDMR